MPSKSREPRSPLGIKFGTWVALAFLYFPLAIILLYAFTTDDRTFTFPPPGLTTDWFGITASNQGFRDSLVLSVIVAIAATAIALFLGTLLALAVSRFKFFGRDAISFLVVLPIALPGIVTGIALQSAVKILGIPFSTWTIIIGHATFCIVTVYNNVVARLRRSSPSMIEASMDLGASTLQTFRYVVLPAMATALLAGGMLAFALSFDEIIVTTFTAGQQETLPIWIFTQLNRSHQRPVTNVAAVFVILATAIPILLASRLTQDVGSEQ
jgi:putative spermidine/putrescine transport system permease protein